MPKFVLLIETDNAEQVEGLVVDLANKRSIDFSKFRILLNQSLNSNNLADESPLLEALIAPGASRIDVLGALHTHLRALNITDELVIVDPYFLAKTTDVGYPEFVYNTLLPVAPNLSRLVIVTLPGKKADANTLAGIESRMGSAFPSLKISHYTTTKFHDRFWINRTTSSGFLSGTSLNGLGSRYALLAPLDSQDVAAVIAALKNANVA
jgi:hypothetical protein